MNMFARQMIKSPEYHHMICIGKTKCTSEKGLFLNNTQTAVINITIKRIVDILQK